MDMPASLPEAGPCRHAATFPTPRNRCWTQAVESDAGIAGTARKATSMGLILLVVILFLLFGGGGYYGYRSGYYGGRGFGGGLTLVVVIIVLFLLFGGGGYYHY
jgi:hypothetical protein